MALRRQNSEKVTVIRLLTPLNERCNALRFDLLAAAVAESTHLHRALEKTFALCSQFNPPR